MPRRLLRGFFNAAMPRLRLNLLAFQRGKGTVEAQAQKRLPAQSVAAPTRPGPSRAAPGPARAPRRPTSPGGSASLAHVGRHVVEIGALRSGRITSVRPAACAASTFCLRPPIGSTRPCSVTSPVMPTVCLTGRPVSSDASAVTIVDAGARAVLGDRAGRHVDVELACRRTPRRRCRARAAWLRT